MYNIQHHIITEWLEMEIDIILERGTELYIQT